MQTGREAIAEILAGNRPQRIPFFDFPWWDTLKKWTEHGYPKNEKGDPVEPADHFGYDQLCVGGWFDILPLRGVSEIVEETDEWKVVRNGAGACLKWWKHHSGTPEHVAFDMTTREVWEAKYRSHLLTPDRQRVNLEWPKEQLPKRRQQGIWSYYGHMFIWENMRQSMGDIALYENLLLDEGYIHDYNRVYTAFFKAHFKLMFDECGVPDGVWLHEDMGYKGRTFASPELFGKLIFPYFAEIVEWLHSYKVPVVLHTCGFVEPLVDMIIDAGFDALNPMEVKAGNDPLKLARQYHDRIAFFGGLDERVLESGDRTVIERAVRELCEGMKAAGARFVFATDHSISTNVTYDDYRYALDVYRKHSMY